MAFFLICSPGAIAKTSCFSHPDTENQLNILGTDFYPSVFWDGFIMLLSVNFSLTAFE